MADDATQLELPPCPACGTPLDDVSITEAVVTCPGCGATYDVEVETPDDALPDEDAALGETPATPPRTPPALPEGGLPAGLTVRRDGERLRLVHRWFSSQHVVLAVFAVAWNGFLLAWFGIAYTQGEWVMALMGSVHLLVGLVVAYGTLAGFLNRTTVQLAPGRLTVRHGPVPWPGSVDVPAADLDQLFTVQTSIPTKHGHRYTYELHARLADGHHVVLVRNLQSAPVAQAMEARVEAALGIVDRQMPGEFH